MGIFDGLESLGFKQIKEIELFKKKETAVKKTEGKIQILKPEDYLYSKNFTCPVCDKEFSDTVVRKGKVRYIDSHTDLRACYEPIDPMYYDVVMCSHCGYAAISSQFSRIMFRQGELIKQKITPQFKPKDYPLVLTPEMAIERYKLALLNAVIKGSKNGERAFICLKLGWLYRHLRDEANEKLFIAQAYTGLKEAYSDEPFPICGLDEPTLAYLIGELARRNGDSAEALRWMSSLIVRRDINTRLKDKANIIKDLIRAETNSEGEKDEEKK